MPLSVREFFTVFKEASLYITSDSCVRGRREMNVDKSGKPKLRKVFLR